ncbi:ell-associated factor Eaf-like [Rhopalosiphum padi]|uniref:ell-associated factor Eaf-like n=1 Tax=Rhopalosiphum padi TaxID=40932 RepID=UPI00298D607B|nr:ell-associated factor Eaf-like [Rhopalosiphum padi]
MSATTTTTTADCELLGRGPVQGSADSDSLATLVRQLCKKQQQRGRLPGRRCTVSCSRDVGLEIVPYQRKRPDDEGFESDEDLASLGSYDDPAKRKTGTLAAVSAAAGAASDSANSSGVSEDSDDADAASLRGGQAPVVVAAETADGSGREAYGLNDVAFCHTDAAALPGIAVWVIKTRRTPSAGLEAIVVRSRDNRLQDVCRAYQEHSRRMKLEPKPWAGHGNSGGGPLSSQRRKIGVGVGAASNNIALTAMPEVNRFNLVQRTDTDGVTHIEVTAGPVVAAANSTSRDSSQSSIISISTPESPRPTAKDRSYGDEDDRDRDDGDGGIEPPPQRPERRKYKVKSDGGDGTNEDYRRQQKVVRGQFIRVNVNHCAVLPPASPEPERKSGQESPAKSTTGASPTAVVSDRLWSTADYDRLDGRYEQHRRSSNSRTRSRSTGPGRRQQHPLQLTAVQPSHPPPVAFSRYPNVEQQQQQPSSFGNRFFGKLREITSGNQSPPLQDLQPVAFRRRNSVGESVTANFYQYFSHQHHHQHHQHGQYQQQQQQHQLYQQQLQLQQQQQQQRQQAKNGGHLKSVIKKNNKSQLYQHTYDEPKKVTFSAYATVQVVD